MAAEHYLYVIGTDDGPTKIGSSNSPEPRLRAFQREGRKASLAGVWPVERKMVLAVERYVHWQLRERHIRGEWFNVTREAAAQEIDAALAKSHQIDPKDRIPPLDVHGSHSGFAAGTLDRIDRVLEDKESRAGFIREAVERELARRERKR